MNCVLQDSTALGFPKPGLLDPIQLLHFSKHPWLRVSHCSIGKFLAVVCCLGDIFILCLKEFAVCTLFFISREVKTKDLKKPKQL